MYQGNLFADGPSRNPSHAALHPQALDSAPRPRSAMLDAPGLQETD